MSAKLIQVIEVERNRGRGVDGDPVRTVTQYWSVDGVLLAEKDPGPSQLQQTECSTANSHPFQTGLNGSVLKEWAARGRL